MTELSRNHDCSHESYSTAEAPLLSSLCFAYKFIFVQVPSASSSRFREWVETDGKLDLCWDYEVGKMVHVGPRSLCKEYVPRPCYSYVKGRRIKSKDLKRVNGLELLCIVRQWPLRAERW